SFPSPLKSPTTTAVLSDSPSDSVSPLVKVPSPFESQTITPPSSATARSSAPSPLKSPAAMPLTAFDAGSRPWLVGCSERAEAKDGAAKANPTTVTKARPAQVEPALLILCLPPWISVSYAAETYRRPDKEVEPESR